MKTIRAILITLLLVSTAAKAAEVEGFVLRAVVTAESPGAIAIKRSVEDGGEVVYLAPAAILSTEDVRKASTSEDSDVTFWLDLTKAGEAKIKKATEALQQRQIAIVISGELISTPTVAGVIHGSIQVSGNFTQDWAESVVDRINQQRK